jgi:hypothetical protein
MLQRPSSPKKPKFHSYQQENGGTLMKNPSHSRIIHCNALLPLALAIATDEVLPITNTLISKVVTMFCIQVPSVSSQNS